MAGGHWFDALSKGLVSPMPRRAVLQTAAAVAAGLLDTHAPAAARKKRAKKTPKSKPKKDAQCGRNACRAVFAAKQDRAFCETKCRRCKKAGTSFCIVEGDPADPAKLATCCHRGETCCPDIGCISQELTCCSDDATLGACYADDTCCPGAGCVNTSRNRRHCGRCGTVCANGESCIDGACVADQVCPPRTVPCGGPDVWRPNDCCERAACFGCEAVADPQNPGVSRAQCVYRCQAGQICLDAGEPIGGVCCWGAGHGCNPNNASSVATCCSGRCERDDASGGYRCA